ATDDSDVRVPLDGKIGRLHFAGLRGADGDAVIRTTARGVRRGVRRGGRCRSRSTLVVGRFGRLAAAAGDAEQYKSTQRPKPTLLERTHRIQCCLGPRVGAT